MNKKIFLLLPLLVPFNSISILPKIHVLDIYILFIFLLSLFTGTFRIKNYNVFSLILFFFMATIFSELFISEYIGSIIQVKYLELLLYVLVLQGVVFSKNDIQFGLYCIVLSGLIISLGSLLRIAINPEMHRYAGYFIFSNGIDGSLNGGFNEIGAFLSVSLIIAINRVINSKFSHINIVIIVIIFFGLYLTKSRSSLIAFFCSLSYFFLIGNFARNKKILLSIAIICILLILIKFDVISTHRYMQTFIPGTFENYTMMERFVYWERGINSIFYSGYNFIFGFGYDGMTLKINGSTTDNFMLDNILRYGFLGGGVIFLLYILPIIKNKSDTLLVSIFIIALIVSISGNVLASLSFGGTVFMIIYSFYWSGNEK